jgi:hypothetical protein
MTPIRLRLSEFCELFGLKDEKETVRSIVARDEAPFSNVPMGGKQLTYGSHEILAWCLYTQMRNMGLPAKFAAEAIRGNDIVDQVFKAYDRDGLSDLFLVVDRTEKRAQAGDVRPIVSTSLQDIAGVTAILKDGAVAYGTKNLQGEDRLGLSGATIIPVLPCVERCEAAVESAGFVMQGSALYERD